MLLWCRLTAVTNVTNREFRWRGIYSRRNGWSVWTHVCRQNVLLMHGYCMGTTAAHRVSCHLRFSMSPSPMSSLTMCTWKHTFAAEHRCLNFMYPIQRHINLDSFLSYQSQPDVSPWSGHSALIPRNMSQLQKVLDQVYMLPLQYTLLC